MPTKQNLNPEIPEAMILEIMRMSTEDGPGLRTTVFFKGCGLRCGWCHNPESISMKPQVQWVESRCLGCRLCLDVCTRNARSLDSAGLRIDREACAACGACVEECPSGAMEMWGWRISLTNLVKEVLKDKAFFGESGGVTASGGEATMQAPFVADFFRLLQRNRVHTALDTCGHCPRKSLDLILPHADMVLYDLKEMDSERHREFTGAGNERILENFTHVAGFIRGQSIRKDLWVRTPIIPDATDHPENIMGIGRFLAEHADGAVSRWELCAFNNLCKDKYARLGRKWDYQDARLVTRERMEMLAILARKSGVDPKIVHWSGSTRIEEHEKGSEDQGRPRSVQGRG